MISESEQDTKVIFPVVADRNMQNKHKNNRLFRHTKQAVVLLFNKKSSQMRIFRSHICALLNSFHNKIQKTDISIFVKAHKLNLLNYAFHIL